MMTDNAKQWHALHVANGSDNSDNRSADTPLITPDNRGMAYGDGFFSTMGVIDGAILWQPYHQQRLLTHAHALQLHIPLTAIMAHLQTHAEQLQQGMMKLIITRAPQALRGYGFVPNQVGCACEIWLKTTAISMSAQYTALPAAHNVLMQAAMPAICLQAQLACLPAPLAGLKTLNRLDNVLASGELHALKAAHPQLYQDCGEGLVRDMSGHWIEGTMSNVFYQLRADADGRSSENGACYDTPSPSHYLLNGQWFTPPLTQSGVAGVLRQVVIDALAQTQTPVIVRALSDEDLPQLTRLFFCNALRGVMPVTVLTLLSGERVFFRV